MGEQRMNDVGFIKLYRAIRRWQWWEDKNTFRLFLFLLTEVNFATGMSGNIIINPGQTLTTRLKLMHATGLSEQQVRTSMNKLKSTGEITIKTTNHYHLITVMNWDLYQSDESKPTKEITSEHPHEQPRYKKERKKETNICSKLFDEFYALYPKKVAKADAQKAWVKINPDEELFDTIMLKLRILVDTDGWKKEDGKFIPYPATWLNKRRWEDEIGEATKPMKSLNDQYSNSEGIYT